MQKYAFNGDICANMQNKNNILIPYAEIIHICRKICNYSPHMQKYAFNSKICTNMQNKNSLNRFHMPQNMYNLLIQDVLVNREKYVNAYNSQPY
jgi:hypothetical protein